MEIIQTIGRLPATQGVWDLSALRQQMALAIRGLDLPRCLRETPIMATGTASLRYLVCFPEWFPLSPAARLR